MSLSTLGLRFERLLFFAAPLSLASVLILFVVFATETQNERSTARCYESAARFLDARVSALEEAWAKYAANKKAAGAKSDYLYKLRMLLIDSALDHSCYRSLLDEVEVRAKDGSRPLIDGLREEAKKLYLTPIKYSGVELPEKATVGLLGTTATIQLPLFATLLQVVLAPLMLLWLGSLYNTRYRETLLIEKARLVTEVFPHLVNVYPAIRYPEPRRRSRWHAYLKHGVAFLYAATRIGLLSLFIGPAVGAYIAGIALLGSSDYFGLLCALGILVALFACSLLLAEFFPWHYGKTFPGPPFLKLRED